MAQGDSALIVLKMMGLHNIIFQRNDCFCVSRWKRNTFNSFQKL